MLRPRLSLTNAALGVWEGWMCDMPPILVQEL